MIRSRIIPCLLIKNGGLVKTIKFEQPKYVGDPINAVRIFNEKGADELIILDIDATVVGSEPNYSLIKNLAGECQMPLCYGGGVNNVDQFKKIISLGVEKVAISNAALENSDLISEAANMVGSQSVVVVVDVKKKRFSRNYHICTHNGKKYKKIPFLEHIKKVESLGAGEIVINACDLDGTFSGYDYTLIEHVYKNVEIPVTILGGASSLEDIRNLIVNFGTIGAAAGSLFVFKGKYRAVLINYPNQKEKDDLLAFTKKEIN